ncbi:serine/threonine protein kinase [Virgisporangium aliadipatigenens]|uniref:non-specific serine/threonine protein kinase n=1 Tax=Virgisporangium aliadipatigenens TaxID=741659 RepID=A0A8J3YQB4_9ACTN|nr:Stk1 family PASTA domain-containing Ser/Thr kinase [Virgisporangium aliadipatigenens]GIJ49849.1 serine/threonine protein kinase [Virgisporangium aliadipatigenens]
MDTTVTDSFLGALVDGRYRVRARVARGGMATVYTAVDERLERQVALKIIHPAQASDPRFVDRFIDEASTIARLTHPNVVAVYDQGTHEGLPYLVMEYVRGRTLREVLADRRRLQPAEALAVLDQVLAAVAAAHRAGLVHRDVKPENILVAESPGGTVNAIIDGVVKVADFGLARAVERSTEDAGSPQLLATAAYVAPELVTSGHADPRTDVYSAGIVLFEMLTGQVPYDGERPVDVAWQHVQQDVPPPSRFVAGLPPLVDELVERATRRDPGSRPTDAGAMLAEVQAAREDVGMTVRTRHTPPLLSGPTVVVPQIAGPRESETTMLPRVEGARPAWARLPGEPPRPRSRRNAPARSDGIGGLLRRVNADPRGRIALAAALVTIGLLAAFGGWWFGIGRYDPAPGVVAMTKAEAEATAKKFDLTVKYTEPRFDDKAPKDRVLAQQPAAGERIASGGTLTLTLSLGPEKFVLPDLVGYEVDLAMQQLKDLKVVVERRDDYSDVVEKGRVIGTDPPANGQEVSPGFKLTLIVSKGRAPLTVPRVIGQNVSQATNALSLLGLQVVTSEKEDSRPAGEVIGQDPPEGSSAEKGQTVTLTVSKGPPEVEVPNVQGQNPAQAKANLEGLGFVVAIVGGPNAVIGYSPQGRQKRGTTITLYCI